MTDPRTKTHADVIHKDEPPANLNRHWHLSGNIRNLPSGAQEHIPNPTECPPSSQQADSLQKLSHLHTAQPTEKIDCSVPHLYPYKHELGLSDVSQE